MTRGKKKEELSLEEKLEQALVPVEEQPYEVPENWCWVRIKEICEFERGITFPASAKENEQTENNIACLRTANIQDELEIYDLIYVNKCFMKNNDSKLVRKDDIIMSSANSRELVGKTSYVHDMANPMTFGGFLLNIRAKRVLSKYLFYMLRFEFLAGRFRGESTQTTNIANINTTTLGNYCIPLPPLQEQQRIVERIESLFAKLEEAKEKLEDSLKTCNERRNAILQKAYSGTLTEKWRHDHLNLKNCVIENIGKYSLDLAKKDKKFIEDGQSKLKKVMMSSNVCWYKGNIGAISVVTNGSTPSRKCDDYWNGDIPWVSSGEVRNNIIEYTEERITQEGYDNSSVKLLPIGTVLIAMIGEGKTRGQSAILNIEATTNQNIAAIVIEHGQINPKFLWYWLQKQYKRNREKGAGSGPQALNCQRVRELDFIIPPLEEQNEIVRIIDNLMNKENSIINSIETTLDNIEGIRKSILARAFRGELGTNNPKEESSIELLKKILIEA